MPEFDEQLFLKTYKTQANKAFQMLLAEYKERLYWHIRRIVLSHENTDDVLQNTFLKVWQALPNFNQQSNIYTWIYRIATNEALSYLKQNKKHYDNHTNNNEEYTVNTLISDQYFDAGEIEIKLQKALATLPEKQKLVFNMKYFDKLKYEEMAGILNTSVGALKASYHIAVKKIKEYLKNN
jgi:RNA polymerase sigma-70 factor (ECF subfamily)